MTNSLAAKWNQRYQGSEVPNRAAQVLRENLHLLPTQGNALELACGLGGNALLLAQQGLNTEAWDLSEVALQKLKEFAYQRQLSINTCVANLGEDPLQQNSYDVVVVSAFLERSLCDTIIGALKPGGLLFYQTFTQEKIGPGGPSNPDFLLQPGELLQLFSSIDLIAYRQESNCGDLSQGLRNQAYLVARKPV